jgi:hypothetical protein
MSDPKNKDNHVIVLDSADEAVISHSISPILPETGALEGFSDIARIFQSSYSFVKKFQNAPTVLRVELAKVSVGLVG